MKQESENNNDVLEARFIALLNNEISMAERSELLELIASDDEIKSQFEATKLIWGEMETIENPTPSPALKQGFNQMLSDFKSEQYQSNTPGILDKIKMFFTPKIYKAVAYGFAFLMIGSLIGYNLKTPANNTSDVAELSAEVQKMKELMMLSLLDDPMANQRMKAVSYTEELNTVNDKITDALFTTLNNDKNVNVRLVTIEALLRFSDQPKVREGLIQSIIYQDSPMVQVALADAMLKLQEKKSVKQLEEILQKDDINTFVKDKYNQTIKKLI